jgi:hypothetical protein
MVKIKIFGVAVLSQFAIESGPNGEGGNLLESLMCGDPRP